MRIERRIERRVARRIERHSLPASLVAILALCAPAHAQITGRVIDEADAPIAGATVTVQATSTRATTAADGTFTLDVPAGDVTIVAASPLRYHDARTVTSPASGVELRLEPTEGDNSGERLQDWVACANCHSNQVGQYQVAPMYHAGRNTWVHDVYNGTGTAGGMGGFVYTRDSVLAAAEPESECASCHQPEVWLANPGAAMVPFDAANPNGPTRGLSCGVCHQMRSIDVATRPNAPGLFPGVVEMSRPADPAARVMYGVLGDVSYTATDMRAALNPQLTSDVCAACHQDANDPDLDGNFDEPGSVISEPTYLEWLDSEYGYGGSREASCASCHMDPLDNFSACTVFDANEPRPPGQVRSHTFEGTSARFLENSVSLSLSTREEAGQLRVDVSITNDQTGHHVPTGVTIRNMILLVEAFGDDVPLEHTGSQTIHALGGVGDPAQGYYAGLPGKLYAVANEDAMGNSPTFFTDAAGVAFDTRIPALGVDETEYSFRIPDGAQRLRVRARVIYRRSWRALVDAKGWSQDGHGLPLADVAPPHFGHLMEQAERTIDRTMDGGVADGGPDAGTAPPTSSGCGCRAASSGTAGAPALLALALWAVRRRRRGERA